jgi:hypothetical protein
MTHGIEQRVVMKITREWIRAHATPKGGYTRAQLEAIGVPWPPVAGWPDRVIGQEISEEQRRIFERQIVDANQPKLL